MRTRIAAMPVTRVINYKYSQLTEPFVFHSNVLNYECTIPAGFIMDWESVPLFKGTSKTAGLIHDYLCRKDSDPVVTKNVAADVYMEFMEYSGVSFLRRRIKCRVVRMLSGYFHKLTVMQNPLES